MVTSEPRKKARLMFKHKSRLKFNISSKASTNSRESKYEKVPISATEWETLVEKIHRRVDMNHTQPASEHGNFISEMIQGRASRALENYDKNLKVWNRINKFISKKRGSPKKLSKGVSRESLLERSDHFISKKQSVQQKELKKTFAERNGGATSWGFSLRNSHKNLKCPKIVKETAYRKWQKSR